MGTTPQLAAVEGGRWGRGEGGDVKGWVWFSEGAAQQLAARDATRSGWGGRRGGGREGGGGYIVGRVWGLLRSWQLESANRRGGGGRGGERGGGEGGRGRGRGS